MDRDPEALLIFRMGDFYEIYGADAAQAAAILGLDRGDDAGRALPAPLTFPRGDLEAHLRTLVLAGRRAAVLERVADPRSVQGPVERVLIKGAMKEDASWPATS